MRVELWVGSRRVELWISNKLVERWRHMYISYAAGVLAFGLHVVDSR